MKQAESELRRIVAEAMAHHKAGHLVDAEAGFRKALQVSPRHALLTHNLAVVLAGQGKHREAISLLDETIAAEPQYASAHYNRAVALVALGRTKEAIQGFGRTCGIEPEHYAAHRAVAFLLLAQGDRGRALDHFARTYELRRGEDRTGMAARSLTHATRSKLLHDAEQFRYLAGRRRDRQRFEALARAYEEVAKDFPEEVTELSDRQLDMLGDDYNTAINICTAPETAGNAVSMRSDGAALTRQFKEGGTGAVFFDDLLTPQALLQLRRYLLESTIWHDFSHIGGFVASYLEDGLACPLLLQIVDELRAAFPEVLGPHPLSQAWAFKGLKTSAAVDIHADDAAVSVNFWVTPTEANMNRAGGGLAICRVSPPPEWQMRNYDADKDRIAAFLEQHAGDTLIVPYRDNRAVLFESRLFHYSDAPDFRGGYENHRINLTLLFGHHAAS
jgi:tetratricopeptide (TPR) repeat protein